MVREEWVRMHGINLPRIRILVTARQFSRDSRELLARALELKKMLT